MKIIELKKHLKKSQKKKKHLKKQTFENSFSAKTQNMFGKNSFHPKKPRRKNVLSWKKKTFHLCGKKKN